jgi:cellular nucleic acid-binding protein
VSRDCPNGLCFNCSAPGHQSRECPEPRGAGAAKARCLRCGSRSHVAPTCERDYDSEDLAAVTCYVCGVAGHLCCAPPPEHVPEPSCYRCGGGGHFGYECNARFAAPQQGQGGGLAECFRCGGRGHFARECPAALSRAGLPTAGMGFGGMGGGGGGGGGGREVSWQPNAPRSAGPGDAKRSRQNWEDEEEEARRRKQQRHSAGAATYRRFEAEDI